MQYAGVLCLLADIFLLPPADALTIPYDLPDGVYEFTWQPDTGGSIAGWTYFDLRADVNITGVESVGAVPLPVGDHDVRCLLKDKSWDDVAVPLEAVVKPEQQAKAREMLSNWCETHWYVQKDAMVVAVYGDMVWYVCNWDTMFNMKKTLQRCARLEIYDAEQRIEAKCGSADRGEVSIGFWQKTYGRSYRYGDICRRKDTWTDALSPANPDPW